MKSPHILNNKKGGFKQEIWVLNGSKKESQSQSSESGRATSHDFALTHQLGVEFCAVEREVDVEVDAVEGALRCVHTFEILLEVLAAEVGGECDDFLDA